MISRRTSILAAISMAALVLAFSGFTWLFDAARAQRRPLPHQVTASKTSWDPLAVWDGPTPLQKVSILICVVSGFLALWSLKRDARFPPKKRPSPFEWSEEDDEALRRYLDEQRKHAS